MADFIYRVGSFTRRLGRPPHFVRSDLLLKGGFQFASVYAVREEDARAIEETAGTAGGFRGVVWSRRLWVDFDEREPGERAIQWLKENGYDFVVYDTGGRGCHIGVLRDSGPSHILPSQDKAWASEYMVGCDLGLYWHLHLLRLPGAIHDSTNRKKVLRGRYPGKPLILPRSVDTEESMHTASTTTLAANRGSIFNIFEVTSRLTEEPGQSKHRQLVTLAKVLREEGRVSFDEAMWVVSEVNRGFSEPKSANEILRMVKWAFGIN